MKKLSDHIICLIFLILTVISCSSPDRALSVSNLDIVNSIVLGRQPLLTPERKGEIWFHDASLCKQEWQSCASCHPSEGRSDALNWDLLNDGMGNPKNTKSLLFSHATPPSMISGIRPTASIAVRAGFEHIFFTKQSDEIIASVDAYLKGLMPVESPFLTDGGLSISALKGKEVFEKAGCVKCHSGPYYTNMRKYDVETGKGDEEGEKFDTPTLIEVWRTAPYLYNGKAKDIKEVFTIYNEGDKHGNTSNLTENELNDLINYCLSL